MNTETISFQLEKNVVYTTNEVTDTPEDTEKVIEECNVQSHSIELANVNAAAVSDLVALCYLGCSKLLLHKQTSTFKCFT